MGCCDSLGSLDDSRVEAEGLFDELDLFGYGERLFLRAVAASPRCAEEGAADLVDIVDDVGVDVGGANRSSMRPGSR